MPTPTPAPTSTPAGTPTGAVYTEQRNIGRARHVVNFHDGVKTHADGSPFYDIRVSTNARAHQRFVRTLRATGYRPA